MSETRIPLEPSGYINYRVQANGDMAVRVVGPGLYALGIGLSYGFESAGICILNVTNSLNERVIQLTNNITNYQNTIDQLRTSLNQPGKTPEEIAAINLQIAENQKKLEEVQVNLDATANALIILNANGISTLNQLSKDQQAENAKTDPPPVIPATADPATVNGVTTPAPTSEKTTNTVANDDSGAVQPNPAGSTGAPASASPAAAGAAASGNGNTSPAAPNTPNTATAPGTIPAAGSTTAGPALRTEASDTQPPGKRLKNPLGYCTSYTYQISLYMITPDGYDAFIQSGRKNIAALNQVASSSGYSNAGGAFLVAQSGGINNAAEARAPGFVFDYSIDNLTFRTSTNGKDNASSTNTTEIKFTITEPYGFSFVTNLRKAQDALEKYSGQQRLLPGNPTKQFYILGVRFFGYNENGQPMTGSEVFEGNTLDPNASGSGALFERYYDIVINALKFKIDGTAVVYSIEASSTPPQLSMTSKRGKLDVNINLEASNVEEAFTELTTQINKRQEQLATQAGTPKLFNTYAIKFVGDAETLIGKAKLVSEADLDKYKWPGSGAKNTGQSNDNAAIKNQTPKNTARTFQFSEKDQITDVINKLITQSQFLEMGLKTVYTTALEPPKDKKGVPQVDKGTKTLKWYNCSSQISNARWNKAINDWVYDITYIIQIYDTPVIDSAYANATTKYYGPHKRYEYWYTGKNSEIISYSQELNNTYFTVVLNPPADSGAPADSAEDTTASTETTSENNASQDTNTGPSKAGGKTQPQDSSGRQGFALEAQNSYLTALYDPSAQAEATITIMGDPDFICYDSGYTENQLYSKFYDSPGSFTVNPNGGQVFIEIDFKEAVDYSSSKVNIPGPDPATGGITGEPGTLSINDSIMFWDYPKEVKKLVKGISYMVTSVTSNFSGGAFKQTLKGVINQFNATNDQKSDGTGREAAANTPATTGNTPPAGASVPAGPTPGSTNSTVADSGLVPDPKLDNIVVRATPDMLKLPSLTVPEITIPTDIGAVVDDDASSITTINTTPLVGPTSLLDAQLREPSINLVSSPGDIIIGTGANNTFTPAPISTTGIFAQDIPLT